MNKYKLIKKYPGSPDVDTIVTFNSDDLQAVDNQGLEIFQYQCRDYPDFWEKIEDFKFLILSVISNNFNSVYRYGKIDIIKDPYTHTKLKIKSTRDLTKDPWSIYSVKRVSDDVVFTLGDKFKSERQPVDILKSIELSKDHKTVFLVGEFSKDDITVCEKPEKLFTTEDGVDIYEGMEYIKINKSNLIIFINTAHPSSDKRANTVYFADKTNALNWIKLNKPQYSEKDMLDFANFAKSYRSSKIVDHAFNSWKSNKNKE